MGCHAGTVLPQQGRPVGQRTHPEAAAALDAVDSRIAALPAGTVTACIELALCCYPPEWAHGFFTSEQREALAALTRKADTTQ